MVLISPQSPSLTSRSQLIYITNYIPGVTFQIENKNSKGTPQYMIRITGMDTLTNQRQHINKTLQLKEIKENSTSLKDSHQQKPIEHIIGIIPYHLF